MAKIFRLNPPRIASVEAAGWRAYYHRQWMKMLWLIVALCQEQFSIPFPISLLAGYYTIRASMAWAPVHHDLKKVLGYLERFYRIAQHYSGLPYDPVRVSQLELSYFEVHRRLVEVADKSEFVQTMIDLHSALFGLSPEEVRESAELRVQAANTVDVITRKKSTDVEGDWRRVESYLLQCYASLQQALDNHQD